MAKFRARTAITKIGVPKGGAASGETFAAAARRELFEETGLEAPESMLQTLDVFP